MGARNLNNLGVVARNRGELDSARAYFQRSLEIKERLASDSVDLAKSLHNLGLVARDRGELDSARAYFQRALVIQEKLAPDSHSLAIILNSFGKATRAGGHIARAANLFQRAINILEAQISNLGSSYDIQANYRAQHSEFYRNSIETLLQLHRRDAAFVTLEASRARAFLALLTERDLIFSDVPEDLDRERRHLAFLYERAQKRLENLNPRDHAEQIAGLMSQLHALRRQYEDNTEEIRRASPAFAALRYPEPLDFEGVRQALDPGTVMLSYSVGKEQIDLFVLTHKGPLLVYSLAISEKILRDQLARFVPQVRRAGRRETKSRFEMARSLYRELIEPVSSTIEKGERLLIVPDGILYRLPFAALIRETASPDAVEQNGDTGRGWQYLVEWKPLHTVLSGTVYAEIRKLRRPPSLPRDGARAPVALVAFGDPEYPQELAESDDGDHGAIVDVHVRDAAERHNFKSLPYSRTEVETIANLFDSEPVRLYLGKRRPKNAPRRSIKPSASFISRLTVFSTTTFP